METVQSLRQKLHESVDATERINEEDLALVNIDARHKLMQKKTLELTQFLSAFAKADENVLRLVDEYDHLATDWVYGNDLFWDGSLPAKQIEIITGVVKNNVRR